MGGKLAGYLFQSGDQCRAEVIGKLSIAVNQTWRGTCSEGVRTPLLNVEAWAGRANCTAPNNRDQVIVVGYTQSIDPETTAAGSLQARCVDHAGGVGTVAVIGDVSGYAGHLQHALATLGVTNERWPDDLHVIQLGDLFGGHDDVACAELVGPHLFAGRWTQLVGNWELEAVGGPSVTNGQGRSADPEALGAFANWASAGMVQRAATVTSARGSTGVVTHAGIGYEFWSRDLRAQRDPARAVEAINAMPLEQVSRGGSMCGRPGEKAPGPIWASVAELWGGWVSCPWPQVHGHTTAHSATGVWNSWTPEKLRKFAKADRGHVVFRPSTKSPPIVGIDPGLWDRSPAGSLRPLVFTTD